jgi:hypothetical protein
MNVKKGKRKEKRKTGKRKLILKVKNKIVQGKRSSCKQIIIKEFILQTISNF